jgi:polyhydroxybutyrate depolymerase
MALSGAVYAYYWHSPVPPVPPLSAAIRRATIRAGGRERTYLAYLPAKLPPGSALVIVLHGSGMNSTKMREWTGYEFDRLVDQCRFVALYPDGYQHNWNDCRKNARFAAKKENVDDMSFIRALIGHFKTAHAIDAKRVYAFGYSNGGHMAFRLAMQAPDEIAAIAAVAASQGLRRGGSGPSKKATPNRQLTPGDESFLPVECLISDGVAS